jgi:hypothetical protein
MAGGGVGAMAIDIDDPDNLFAGKTVQRALLELRAGVASPSYRPRVGRYFRPIGGAGNVSQIQDRVMYTPFEIGSAVPIDRIGARVATVGAGSVGRLGIYTATSDGVPGALLIDAGTIDTAGSTGYKEIAVAVTIPAGRNFTAFVPQLSATVPAMTGITSMTQTMACFGFWDDEVVGQTPDGLILSTIFPYGQDGVSGALPAVATPIFTGLTGAATVAMRAA